jgi:hypothetical protein
MANSKTPPSRPGLAQDGAIKPQPASARPTPPKAQVATPPPPPPKK